jgi:hypothetical protein
MAPGDLLFNRKPLEARQAVHLAFTGNVLSRRRRMAIENSAAQRRAVKSSGLENSRDERGHLRDYAIARRRHSLDVPRGPPALDHEIRRELETIIHSFLPLRIGHPAMPLGRHGQNFTLAEIVK